MSDDYNRLLNLLGLLLTLAGVLILFRWGMPFHVPTHGADVIISDQTNVKDLKLERIYTVIGYIGLAALILGTVLQVIAVLMPGKNL